MAGDARAGKPKRKMSGLSEINKRGQDGKWINPEFDHVRMYIQASILRFQLLYARALQDAAVRDL